MGIRTFTTMSATCDNPNCPIDDNAIDINEPFVDAGVYGCSFHRSCWLAMSGPELAKVLGLDDIKWMVNGERGDKVIYSKEPS